MRMLSLLLTGIFVLGIGVNQAQAAAWFESTSLFKKIRSNKCIPVINLKRQAATVTTLSGPIPVASSIALPAKIEFVGKDNETGVDNVALLATGTAPYELIDALRNSGALINPAHLQSFVDHFGDQYRSTVTLRIYISQKVGSLPRLDDFLVQVKFDQETDFTLKAELFTLTCK